MSDNNKISLCIFDLDGVIVDTAKYHYLAWRKLAQTFNFDLSKEQNEALKGVGRIESLEYILKLADVKKTADEIQEMAHLKNQWYLDNIVELKAGSALPGVVDFILELKAKKIKVAIGSASKNAKLILNNLEIIDLFDAIVDGTMTKQGKPNPEVFLRGAELTATPAFETVVFEDASKGIDAALNAKMIAIGIGQNSTLGHAHHVIPGFCDINYLKFIKMINK